MSAPLPVTVVGGYLGAGKTTLINHLLRHAGGRRLAVLVNEFGALSIDEDLIEAEGEGVISIAGGCICCSFGDNLVGALIDLGNLSPRPDHVLIEASGVAIPASIAATISLLPDVRLDGVVVLADVETVREYARDRYVGDTIIRQLQDADLVVATKVDLVDAAGADAVCGWLTATAGGAEVVPAARGRVPPEVVLGPRARGQALEAVPHADHAFESMTMRVEQPVDARRLAARLAEGDLGVIRAKGFVMDISGACQLIQIVGRRWELTGGVSPSDPAIVCIGSRHGLRKRELRKILKAAQEK